MIYNVPHVESILYLPHAHIYTSDTLLPWLHSQTNVLWCFDVFVVYYEFIRVRAINILSSNEL